MGAALSCFKKRGEGDGAKDAAATAKEQPQKAEKVEEKVREASAAAAEEIVPETSKTEGETKGKEEVTEEASKGQTEEIFPKKEQVGEGSPQHEPDEPGAAARAIPEAVQRAEVEPCDPILKENGYRFVENLTPAKPAPDAAYVPPKPSPEPIPVEQFWDVTVKGLEHQKPPPEEEEPEELEEEPEEPEEEPEEPEEKPEEPEDKPEEPEDKPEEPEEKPEEPEEKPEEPEEKPEEPQEKPEKPDEKSEKPKEKPKEQEKMPEEQVQASGRGEDKVYSDSRDLPDVGESTFPGVTLKTPVKEEAIVEERTFVRDQKAKFEQAKDELPKPKPLSKDIKDPVTGEMVTLEEFKKRIKIRGGVVDTNVKKYEEISNRAAQEQAELKAQREFLELTRKNSKTRSGVGTEAAEKTGLSTPKEATSPDTASPSVSAVTAESASASESTAVKGLLGIPSAPVVSETSAPETPPPAERLQKDTLSTPDSPEKGAAELRSPEIRTAPLDDPQVDAAVAALMDIGPSDKELEPPKARAVPELVDQSESTTYDEAQEGLPRSAAPVASLAEAPEYSESPKLDSAIPETPAKSEPDALTASDTPGEGATSLPVATSKPDEPSAPKAVDEAEVVSAKKEAAVKSEDPVVPALHGASPVPEEAKIVTSDASEALKVAPSQKGEMEEALPQAIEKGQKSAEPVKPQAAPQMTTTESGESKTAGAHITQSGTPSAQKAETKSSEPSRGFFKSISRRLSSPNRGDLPRKSRVKDVARKISSKLSS